MYPLELEAGRTVFDRGDPSDALHIIQEGEIEVVISDGGQLRTERAAPGTAMGRRAFLAGTPHSQKAVTTSKTTILVLPRREFLVLLENSSTLRQRVHLTIRAPDMKEYLVQRHGLPPQIAEQRIADSAHEIYQHGRLADAVPVERHEDDFVGMAEKIQRLPFLHDLPESELNAIAGKLLYKRYPRGHALFHPGELSERAYVVHEGEITLHSPRDSSRRGRVIEAGSAFGTFSFLTGGRHTMGAVAAEDSSVWELTRTDLQELLHEAPGLREALAKVLQDDNVDNYLVQAQHVNRDRAGRWVGQALRNLGESRLSAITEIQPRGVEMAHGAALAIWLGILLDGVPESFVIGASLVERGISLSLIAGLFLSNFPEALSSSAGMREQGFSRPRILMMWTSLMLITGIGAALGNVLLTGASHATLSLVEGVAAGAMLTMIAQTMLPEAYFRGGNIVGFATLLGFLAAIFFSTIGPAH
jgi:CRP-like cAMP-binding protein